MIKPMIKGTSGVAQVGMLTVEVLNKLALFGQGCNSKHLHLLDGVLLVIQDCVICQKGKEPTTGSQYSSVRRNQDHDNGVRQSWYYRQNVEHDSRSNGTVTKLKLSHQREQSPCIQQQVKEVGMDNGIKGQTVH